MTKTNPVEIVQFLKESNEIEGIIREPYSKEIERFTYFLELPKIGIGNLDVLVNVFQPDAHLRVRIGSDVRVGDYYPPRGGPLIEIDLKDLLRRINNFKNTPFQNHLMYENLHPFTDGNGRSGRALWAWQMLKEERWPGINLGFKHAFYYQTLQESRS